MSNQNSMTNIHSEQGFVNKIIKSILKITDKTVKIMNNIKLWQAKTATSADMTAFLTFNFD